MRKSKPRHLSLYCTKKDTGYVKFYVRPKILFTDVLLILMSIGVFIIIIRLKEGNSSDFNIWIVFFGSFYNCFFIFF